MPTVTTRLTDEQRRHFEEEGYLAIDALTTQEEIAWLREVYDRIFRERAGREEGNQFDLAGTDEEGKEAALPQILNPAKYAPELNQSQLLANRPPSRGNCSARRRRSASPTRSSSPPVPARPRPGTRTPRIGTRA